MPINSFSPDTSLTLLQAQQGTQSPEVAKKFAQAEHTASEFEGMMLAEMLKPMFESVAVDDTFGGGKGEEVFRGFMVQEYGKIMARAGGIGIADAVKQHLIEMQGLNTASAQFGAQALNAIDVTGVEE